MATTPDKIYAEEEQYKAYNIPTVNTPKMEYTPTTPTYEVDYNDERFGKVESDKNQALTELEQTYGDLTGDVDNFYNNLSNTLQQQADKQAQIQKENTDFAIEKIEQQKEQAQKDYIKEQSGAYVDWQKQSNQYGVNAEKMASAGLWGTGYSESSQVSMYNTYQNRVATAREVLSQAKLNYDNGIKEAMLQNNAALAEIYGNLYVKQAELALEGFQYKNQLIIEQANKKLEIDQMYYNRWQNVLNQINTENAMAEDIRQHNDTMKWNTEKANADYQFEAKLKEIEIKYKDYADYLAREHEKKMLNAKTQAEKDLLTEQHNNDMKKLAQQLQNEKDLLDKKLQNEKALIDYEYSKKSATITGGNTGGNKTIVYQGNGTVGTKPKVVDYSKGTSTGFTGKTYEAAYNYLVSKGVPKSYAAGMMTMGEWSRRKTSLAMHGQGGAETKNYNTYQEYLADFVEYCIGKQKNGGK